MQMKERGLTGGSRHSGSGPLSSQELDLPEQVQQRLSPAGELGAGIGEPGPEQVVHGQQLSDVALRMSSREQAKNLDFALAQPCYPFTMELVYRMTSRCEYGAGGIAVDPTRPYFTLQLLGSSFRRSCRTMWTRFDHSMIDIGGG